MQEMLQNLPAIAPGELKAGDAVFIVGSQGADTTRLTAVTVLTGDAEFLNRLGRFQGGRNGRDRQQPDSPGLPGDVVGGGIGNREQP
jgi:hypothetical protein